MGLRCSFSNWTSRQPSISNEGLWCYLFCTTNRAIRLSDSQVSIYLSANQHILLPPIVFHSLLFCIWSISLWYTIEIGKRHPIQSRGMSSGLPLVLCTNLYLSSVAKGVHLLMMRAMKITGIITITIIIPAIEIIVATMICITTLSLFLPPVSNYYAIGNVDPKVISSSLIFSFFCVWYICMIEIPQPVFAMLQQNTYFWPRIQALLEINMDFLGTNSV